MTSCDSSERAKCFKESLKSLEDGGFKKRQGKKMLHDQAMKAAYEAFYDCNCTDESEADDDCHAQAKEAWKDVKSVESSDAEFDKYYAKMSPRIEYLARVICNGGETTTKLREAIAIEVGKANGKCPEKPDVSSVTAKIKSE